MVLTVVKATSAAASLKVQKRMLSCHRTVHSLHVQLLEHAHGLNVRFIYVRLYFEKSKTLEGVT